MGCLNSVEGRSAYKGQQCVPVKPFADSKGNTIYCERPGTAAKLAPSTQCKLACTLLVSKNQGSKGGYQYCSSYFDQKVNAYIATKNDLECQKACLDNPNCIYATRYSDSGRAFPKKNCHVITKCGTMNHYA